MVQQAPQCVCNFQFMLLHRKLKKKKLEEHANLQPYVCTSVAHNKLTCYKQITNTQDYLQYYLTQ